MEHAQLIRAQVHFPKHPVSSNTFLLKDQATKEVVEKYLGGIKLEEGQEAIVEVEVKINIYNKIL